MAKTARPKKGRTRKFDFTGVSSKEREPVHIPEGKYSMEVDLVTEGTSKNDHEQLEWIFRGTEGRAKNKPFYFYTTLTPASMWKLKQTFEALGFEVPDSDMEVDLDELVGAECIGIVVDDEYQGKVRSKLDRIVPVDGEEEERPSRSRSSGRATNGRAKTKYAEGEVRAMDEDELQDLIGKTDLEVDLGKHKTPRRKADAVVTALEEAGLLEA